MTLEEAIEMLNPLLRIHRARLNINERNAIKLGIEALKAIDYYRLYGDLRAFGVLPGETKE